MCIRDSPETEDERAQRRAEAGERLEREVLSLYSTGQMTAKSLCEIAHLASAAGAEGRVGDWGVRPDRASSGQYQRHVQDVADARGIQK
eukprot:7266019-Pyramimonas_sp.AAC.1